MIRGTTKLIAHFGNSIAPVKSPMNYNPDFESTGSVIAAALAATGPAAISLLDAHASAADALAARLRQHYLEFFGFGTVPSDELRAVAMLA